MKHETRRKYDDFVRALAEEIAEEQPNMNNVDYSFPITDEACKLFDYGYFEREILQVAKAISLSNKKTPPVGKWDNEAPRSYRRFEKSRLNLKKN